MNETIFEVSGNSFRVCMVVSTTQDMPAFLAASTPLGASSNTRQSFGRYLADGSGFQKSFRMRFTDLHIIGTYDGFEIFADIQLVQYKINIKLIAAEPMAIGIFFPWALFRKSSSPSISLICGRYSF